MLSFQWPVRRPWTGLCLAGPALLAGLLFCASIPKFDQQFLAWICLLPCFLILPLVSPRQLALAGLIFGTVAATGRTYWITETLQLYGHLALVQALATNILLILYLALYPAVFLWICARWRFTSPLFPWLAASLWILLEWSQSWILTGFPWYLLGYSQYLNRPIVQLASVTGVYGISFLLVLVNATLAQLLVHRRPLVHAPLPLLALVATLLFGYAHLASFPAASTEENRTIGIVQGNIGQDKKWNVDRNAWTTQHYSNLARSLAAQKPDLIVFPETALPYRFNSPARAAQYKQTIDLARQLDVPLLVGSLQSTYEFEQEKLYNRAYLIETDGHIRSWADKVHLVPFGEYLPLPFFFQYLEGLVEESGIFAPGKRHQVLTLPESTLTFGIFICYESIFPEITRILAQQGASFLINTTNDAWFGHTAAPYQHFAMVVLRAVETGLPILRAANTGISGLIGPSGKIIKTTDIFETAAFVVEVAPRLSTTLYVRYGDVALVLSALFLAAIALLRGLQSKKSVDQARRHALEDLAHFAQTPKALTAPIIILHGYQSDTKHWDVFTTHLRQCSSAASVQLIIPDLNQNLTIPELAQQLRPTLPTDQPIDLIGHSLGALVAVELSHQTNLSQGHIIALSTPFGGTFLARLARLLRFSLPRLLADMAPQSAFTQQLPARIADLGPRLSTFGVVGDPIANGPIHHTYEVPWWTLPNRRHRLAHTDPRIIRDLIALLQGRA
jgi:apolipoprotein N-acyltransferase